MQDLDSNKKEGRMPRWSVWKNAIRFAAVGVVIFLSVRIEPLESRLQREKVFDVEAYVNGLLHDSLAAPIATAPEICALLGRLSSATDAEWASLGRQTAIGSRYCFLVRGTGIVERVEADAVVLRLTDSGRSCDVRVATEYVFGNEIRDATGMVRLEDFDDLTTFNQVSEFINERIRTQVLPPFVNEVRSHDTVDVVGACCINKRLMGVEDVELVPLKLNILR